MERLTTLLATAVLLVACGGTPDPIAVPDLAGLTLDIARDTIGETDLEIEEVDASGQDRSIWSAGNWTVIGQDPAAGSEVEPGATVTVEVENVRDTEPEPTEEPDPEETTEAPEEATEEPTPDPEPTTEDPGTDLHAEVDAGPAGLTITTEADVHTCKVDLNGGLIRSGYTTELVMLTARESYTIPWGDLTDRDGTRFDYSSTAPKTVTIDCYDEGDNWMVATWSW